MQQLNLLTPEYCLSPQANPDDEKYTPAEIVERARRVMGSIDCDPASCDEAQSWIQAGVYYTIETNGLAQPWGSAERPYNVWLNPPFSQYAIWVEKLFAEVQRGYVAQSILLVNGNYTSSWFWPLWDYWKAFPKRRIQFRYPGAEGSPDRNRWQQVLIYHGSRIDAFTREFSDIAAIVPPQVKAA